MDHLVVFLAGRSGVTRSAVAPNKKKNKKKGGGGRGERMSYDGFIRRVRAALKALVTGKGI